MGVDMNSLKRFSAYIEDRPKCFDLMHEKYNMPPSKVKKQFLRLMFGGQLSSDMLHDHWWTGLANEFRTLLRLICDQYPDEYAAVVTRLKKNGEKHKSAEGSVASSVVFNIENMNMQTAVCLHLSNTCKTLGSRCRHSVSMVCCGQ